MYLKSTLNPSEKYDILYADIEAITDNEGFHIPIALAYSNNDKSINISRVCKPVYINNILDSKKVKREFSLHLLNMLENINKNTIILCHNFGRYDVYLILETLLDNYISNLNIIQRSGIIYQVSIKIKNIKINFRDSYLIIPIKLNDFLKCGISSNQKIDYNNKYYLEQESIWNTTPNKVSEYVLNDVDILREGFLYFTNNINKTFNCNYAAYTLTIPGLAFKIFKNKFMIPNSISKNIKSHELYIRESYMGGRTEIFKPYSEKAYYYDVNSLYPYCMQMPLPTKPIGDIIYSEAELLKFDINKNFGFVTAIVYVDHSEYFPILPIKDKSKGMLFPTGEFKGTWFTEELKFAINNSKTNIICIISFLEFKKNETGLKDYVQTLYKNRLKYDKKNGMNFISKLLLNSLYGRFGMKTDNVTHVYIKSEDTEKTINKENTDIRQLIDLFTFGDNNKYTRLDFIESLEKETFNQIDDISQKQAKLKYEYQDLDSEVSVPIAAATSSYARITLAYYIKKIDKEDLIYSDTDSIVTKSEIHPSFVSSSILGKLKLEGSTFIEDCIFIDIKTYSFKQNNEFTNKFKGVPQSERANKDIIHNILKNNLLNKEKYTFLSKIRNFVKNKINLTIKNTEFSDYPIRNLTYKKRLKIFNKEGLWIDTHPINYNKISSDY